MKCSDVWPDIKRGRIAPLIWLSGFSVRETNVVYRSFRCEYGARINIVNILNQPIPVAARCGSAAVRWLELRVRILPGAGMSVVYGCFVLWDRGLCDGPITCLEVPTARARARVCVCGVGGWVSVGVWVWVCVSGCDREEPLAHQGLLRQGGGGFFELTDLTDSLRLTLKF